MRLWPQPLRLACLLLPSPSPVNSAPTALSILRLSSLHHRSTSATDDATTPCRAKRRYIWPLSNIECTHPPRQTLPFPVLEAPKPPLVTSCWSPWFSCRVHTLATLVPASRRFGLDTGATSAADAGIALPSPSSPSRRPRCLPKPTLPHPQPTILTGPSSSTDTARTTKPPVASPSLPWRPFDKPAALRSLYPSLPLPHHPPRFSESQTLL